MSQYLNPTDPDFRSDPYPAYAKLRSEEPIHRIELSGGQGMWLVTRYGDAEAVLKDARFVKDFRNAFTEAELGNADPMPKELLPLSSHMLAKDPPDHSRLRRLVSRAFTPRFIEGLRPRVQEIADSLLDDVERRTTEEVGDRTMDLIDDYAFPLPITVITEMLGVPTEDRDKFRAWSNTAVSSDMSGQDVERFRSEMGEFIAYLRDFFEQKRKSPSDDLTSGLIRAEEAGDKLDEDELLAMIFLLLVAGHETTVNLIGNGTLALLTHPMELNKLKKDPSLIGSAVEELLRYDGPVETTTNRFASEDIEIEGVTIPRGEFVLVVLGSADRDATRFDDPEGLDIEREGNRHLAFGKGIHHCLGAPLARLEGQVAIGTLVKRMPDLRLGATPEKLLWRPGLLIRGLQALPLRF